jgi:hypothetical protein
VIRKGSTEKGKKNPVSLGERHKTGLNITGTEIYVPVEAQRMLEGTQKIRLKIY